VEQLRRLTRLPGKIARHLALLRQDPEKFGFNLLQFTNPALFEQRLVDIAQTGPLHLCVDPALRAVPALNALLPEVSAATMTGGPNTVVNLIFRVARHGIPVRLVATRHLPSIGQAEFRRHAAALTGTSDLPDVRLACATDAGQPLAIGPNDVFLATHWTTAQQVKPVLPRLDIRQFFYLIQDFEAGFFPWSNNHALALETLGLDHWPIFNQSLLAEFCIAQQVGRFAEAGFADRAIVFEPAVDAQIFQTPSEPTPSRPKRLLFYARPRAARNMFGLGLLALRQAAADPAFTGWEFLAIGSPNAMPELALTDAARLRIAPWLGYKGYAELLSNADVLLCPMLSPHTSYPVLEMAACGGLAVTNTFATKTAAALARLSDNIVAAPPTVEGLHAGLLQAAVTVNRGRRREVSLNVPRDWAAALDPVAARMAEIFRHLAAPS
jgi:hypothetical protein